MKLRHILVLLTALTALVLPGLILAQEEASNPAGFDQTLVYMATGVFDPADEDYTPPDGDFWHTEIMGRSEAEIEADRQAAIAFFVQRFGIDPTEHDGVAFTSFMVDPRNEYRAYFVPGYDVPEEGWVVRDGGWRMAVTAEDGIELGGEFEGTTVPQGTIMVYGDYNIDTGDEPIIIHYQSGSPIVPGPFGMSFQCEISHDEWGTGLAQGIVTSGMGEDGLMHANIRNVLTFPGNGTEDAAGK